MSCASLIATKSPTFVPLRPVVMAATHGHSYADYVDEDSDPLVCAAAGPNDEDPSVHRTVLIDAVALDSMLRAKRREVEQFAWMDHAQPATRERWSAVARANYQRLQQSKGLLRQAEAIDRHADPNRKTDSNGIEYRELAEVYSKGVLDMGRRTPKSPGMALCFKELRAAVCSEFYHDVDMVSCHPTLMLQAPAPAHTPATATRPPRVAAQ